MELNSISQYIPNSHYIISNQQCIIPELPYKLPPSNQTYVTNTRYIIPMIQTLDLPKYQHDNLVNQTKTDNCCSKTKGTRRKFSEEEDNLLKQLVNKYGIKEWDKIAQKMPGRTGRQCRDRYTNYLVNGFFHGQWSKFEDELLLAKYMEFGPRWSKIKTFFNNRNANSIKNRWNYFVSRQLPNNRISVNNLTVGAQYQDNNNIDKSLINHATIIYPSQTFK